MFSIHCYTENADKLFEYKSNIIPNVGDHYSCPCGLDGHFEVVTRILHTAPGHTEFISLWLKPI